MSAPEEMTLEQSLEVLGRLKAALESGEVGLNGWHLGVRAIDRVTEALETQSERVASPIRPYDAGVRHWAREVFTLDPRRGVVCLDRAPDKYVPGWVRNFCREMDIRP